MTKALAMGMAAVAAIPLLAQVPFTLDTTFCTAIEYRAVNSILLQDDGRIIASGIMRFPGEMSDKSLVRLNSDGTRDESFNNSGLGGVRLSPWNDRFYVGTNQTVRRILTTGQQDPSFIGMNLGPYFSSLQGGDYHVYPDGRVLMSGTHTLSDTVRGFVGNYNLIWFSNQGYLDTTRVHKQGNGPIYNFGEYLDGSFLCSGNASVYESEPVDKIFRVDAEGNLDTSFHSLVYLGHSYDYLPLPDGRIYVAGNFWRSDAPPQTHWLARFMPDGSLDPTWTEPQLTVPDYLLAQGSNSAGAVWVRPWGDDGSVVFTGTFSGVNGHERWGICVLDSTGQVLSPFSNCRIDSTGWWNTLYCSVHGLAFTPDSQFCYVYGAYEGFSDGLVNDTAQGFISRLHVGDITTSTATAAPPLAFALFPNPASGSITLELGEPLRNAVLVIRDALGREQLRQRINHHQTTLVLQHLPNGCYHAVLVSNGERIGHQRLVVQH